VTAARRPGQRPVTAARRSPARLLRGLAVLVVPSLAYFAVRPAVSSDAAALAICGALPLAYQIVLVLVRRRVDPWALVSGLGFAVACVVSLLAGGSSLPLKLHVAAVTFIAGLVLLTAALIRRPLPLARLLKVPHHDRRLDATLSVMVGGFLTLHALLHLALAVTLSTATYVLAGRAIDLATLALGAACLYAYLRRLRRTTATGSPSR
jgi:intracellular septation protein A